MSYPAIIGSFLYFSSIPFYIILNRSLIQNDLLVKGTEMKIEDLGYNDLFEMFRIENNLTTFEVGRIISELKRDTL